MSDINITDRQPVRVEVNNLHKSYGDQHILKGVNFNVEPGEIFVIMGGSGAGKSVLLKQIIGLDSPDKGQVLIAGKDASLRETHKAVRTAIVFQDGALFNSISVYDNLALFPREHRLYDEKTIRDKVMRTLKILSLEHAINKHPSELSGGMKKRVAVARSLMMEPTLMLFDEPTSELDPVLAATISELIATVTKENKLTSIVVSHDRDLAANIGDHVGLLDKGLMRFIGTAKEFSESKEDYIKDFLEPHIDIKNPRFRKNHQ